MQALAARADDATVRAALLAACKDDDGYFRQAAVQALEDWIVRQKFPRRCRAAQYLSDAAAIGMKPTLLA